MGDWQERAIELKQQGRTYNEIADALNAEHLGESFSHARVRGWLRRHGQAGPIATPALASFDLKAELRRGVSLDEIAKKAGGSNRVARAMIDDLVDQGLCIDERNGVYSLSKVPHAEPTTIDRDWHGDKIIRFGITSDAHYGNKYAQISLHNEAYDAFVREGIDTVYDCGDVTEGENMRPGHAYECYVHGADDYVAEIVKNYPHRDGITTNFIIGKHDATFIRHAGLDIGLLIARERQDMIYLGQSQAFVRLTPNCLLELRHPLDGTAYAISYKMQKMIEAMSGGEKPNILACGHYHKSESLFYRNVQCIQAGTLCAQTPWMRGKGISAAVGYWIIEIHVDDDGQINRFRPEWFPQYKAIKDDWRSYR